MYYWDQRHLPIAMALCMYLKCTEDDMNLSERLVKSTVPVNSAVKAIDEKHREDGKGPFSLALH